MGLCSISWVLYRLVLLGHLLYYMSLGLYIPVFYINWTNMSIEWVETNLPIVFSIFYILAHLSMVAFDYLIVSILSVAILL